MISGEKRSDTQEERMSKIIQINLFTKQKQTHRLREQTYGHQGGRVGGRDS